MNTILQSEVFKVWLAELGDRRGRFAIIARIRRASLGNFGNHKLLGAGVYEMKIDYGPGYRVYYAQQGSQIYVLLCGGDKSTQAKDIEKAKALLAEGWAEQ